MESNRRIFGRVIERPVHSPVARAGAGLLILPVRAGVGHEPGRVFLVNVSSF